MKSRIDQPFLVVCAGLLASCAMGPMIQAQSTAFTYQGRLHENDAPVNGPFDLRFALFELEMGGSPLAGPITNSAVEVSAGVFVVTLDFGSAPFDGDDRWLGVSVATSGSGLFIELVPRQPLTSVPYAVRAWSASVLPAGAVTSAMLSEGAVTGPKIAPGAVSQLGTPSGSDPNALQVFDEGGLHVSSGGSPFTNAVILTEIRNGVGGFNEMNGINSVAISGTFAYVTSGTDDSLTIIDISSPANPTPCCQFKDDQSILSQLDGASSVTVSGGIAYITSSEDSSLTLLDVSNPFAPTLVTEIVDEVGGFRQLAGAASVAVSRSTAYVASADDNSLTIIDVRIPASPVILAMIVDEVDGFSELAGANSVVVNGTVAYVTSGVDDALTIIDVSIPTQPELLAEVKHGMGGFNALHGASSVAIERSIAYVTARDSSALTIIDVKIPDGPVLLAELIDFVSNDFNLLEGASSVAVSGGVAYVTAGRDDALTLIDVSSPASPVLIAEVEAGDAGFNGLVGANSVAVSGNLAMVGANAPRNSAVTIVDVGQGRVGVTTDNWLGIGTTTPESELDVAGTVTADRVIASRVSADVVTAGILEGDGSRLTGLDIPKAYSLDASDGSPTGALYVNPEGYVGVGTSAPIVPLHVRLGSDVGLADGGYLVLGDQNGSNLAMDNNEIMARDDGDPTKLFINFDGGQVTLGGNLGIGLGFGTATHPIQDDSGAHLTAAGVWTSVSDRRAKEQFSRVEPAEVLDKVAALPITQWKYKVEAEGVKHIGPVAQDFHAAFGLGESETAIGNVDADGVALVAIQGLNAKVEDGRRSMEQRMRKLEAENAKLKQELAEIKAVVERFRR